MLVTLYSGVVGLVCFGALTSTAPLQQPRTFTDQVVPIIKNLPDSKLLTVSYQCMDKNSEHCQNKISVDFEGFFDMDRPDPDDLAAQKRARSNLNANPADLTVDPDATVGDHYQGTWEVTLEHPPCIHCVATPQLFTNPCPKYKFDAVNPHAIVRECQVTILCHKAPAILLSGYINGSALTSGYHFEVSVTDKRTQRTSAANTEVIVPHKGNSKHKLLRSYFALTTVGVEPCCGGADCDYTHILTPTPNTSAVECRDVPVALKDAGVPDSIVITCETVQDDRAANTGSTQAKATTIFAEVIIGVTIGLVFGVSVFLCICWRGRFQFLRRRLMGLLHDQRGAGESLRLVCERARGRAGMRLTYACPKEDNVLCRCYCGQRIEAVRICLYIQPNAEDPTGHMHARELVQRMSCCDNDDLDGSAAGSLTEGSLWAATIDCPDDASIAVTGCLLYLRFPNVFVVDNNCGKGWSFEAQAGVVVDSDLNSSQTPQSLTNVSNTQVSPGELPPGYKLTAKEKFHAIGHMVKASVAMKKMYAFDIFISYGAEDLVSNFVQQLHQTLTDAGFQVFLDVVEQEYSNHLDFRAHVGMALEHCTTLIPIITHPYVDSTFCKNELYMAEAASTHIIPVIFDHTVLTRTDATWFGVKYSLASLPSVRLKRGNYGQCIADIRQRIVDKQK